MRNPTSAVRVPAVARGVALVLALELSVAVGSTALTHSKDADLPGEGLAAAAGGLDRRRARRPVLR